MRGKILIASTEDAVKKLLVIDNMNLNASLSILGLVTTESVSIKIPRVESPDKDTDAHWTDFVFDSDIYVLDSDNNRRGIPARGVYRISKDASAGNAFGVELS